MRSGGLARPGGAVCSDGGLPTTGSALRAGCDRKLRTDRRGFTARGTGDPGCRECGQPVRWEGWRSRAEDPPLCRPPSMHVPGRPLSRPRSQILWLQGGLLPWPGGGGGRHGIPAHGGVWACFPQRVCAVAARGCSARGVSDQSLPCSSDAPSVLAASEPCWGELCVRCLETLHRHLAFSSASSLPAVWGPAGTEPALMCSVLEGPLALGLFLGGRGSVCTLLVCWCRHSPRRGNIAGFSSPWEFTRTAPTARVLSRRRGFGSSTRPARPRLSAESTCCSGFSFWSWASLCFE